MTSTNGRSTGNSPTQDRLRLVPPPPVSTPEFDAVYDALTALYLAGPPIEPNKNSGTESTTNTNTTTTNDPEQDRVTGPMITAALGSQTLALADNDTIDDSIEDTAEDIYTTNNNTTHQNQSPQSSAIELLLLAHLPVNAAAWAVQYVRDVSSRAGEPVAYIRLQSGCACVELVGSRDNAAASSLGECPSFDAAITEAAKHAARWVIRVDNTNEHTAAAVRDIDELTLLTASDDAAIVAGYQSLKRLGQATTAVSAINVVIVAADEFRGQAAADRILEAAGSFLDRDINTRVCPAKIATFRAPTLLYSGKADTGPTDLPAIIRAAIDNTTPTTKSTATSTQQSQASSSSPTSQTPPRFTLKSRRGSVRTATLRHAAESTQAPIFRPHLHRTTETPAIATTPIPLQPTQTSQAAEKTTTATSTAANQQITRTQTAQTTATPQAAPPPPPLERLAGDLRPCNYTCPFATHIKLARDDSGRLHALAAADNTSQLGHALHDLLTISAWADTHNAILSALESESNNNNSNNRDANTEPTVSHIFTTDPRIVARLLDSPHLKLHALARVSTDRGPAWCAMDLNPEPRTTA